MSEFYDKVKKLHDEAVERNIQTWITEAYEQIENDIGKEGLDGCKIKFFEIADTAAELRLIAKLEDDGFKATSYDGTGCIIVTL